MKASGNQSETSKHRHNFLPYLPKSNLIDIGCGGEPIVPYAIACDFSGAYPNSVGNTTTQLDFDCRYLPFKDETLAGCYSSHVLEDFTYAEQVRIIKEWARTLKLGGVIALCQPDQQRFLAHCAATGQSINDNHKEQDYSLSNFKKKVLGNIQHPTTLQIVFEQDVLECETDNYSWMIILKKI